MYTCRKVHQAAHVRLGHFIQLYTLYTECRLFLNLKKKRGILKTYRKMMGQLRNTSKYPRWSEEY